MKYCNEMSLKFLSLSENESFARLAVASFCSNLSLTVEDITDIKTAISEAVTNCVVHAYDRGVGEITINCKTNKEKIHIEVIDSGIGIENISEATRPFYTSKPESERSGIGFTVMEGFMDEMIVESAKDKGTKVTLIKNII
jgi:stage II sporulation protein AB (anti-sigma F factor)